MRQEELGAQHPGQPQGEDPDRGEPHARVVVQVALGLQLSHPGVETGDAGAARHGVGRHRRVDPRYPALVVGPHLRPQFEVALPIGPPEHFLDEFESGRGAVPGQAGAHHLLLGDQPVADVGRELSHRGAGARPRVAVAAGSVVAAHSGSEVGKVRQGGGAGRFDHSADVGRRQASANAAKARARWLSACFSAAVIWPKVRP